MSHVSPSGQYKEMLVASSIVIGWFMGCAIFVLVFALTGSIQLALLCALFFGGIFGLAVYYARTTTKEQS